MYPYLSKPFPERKTLSTPRYNRDVVCGKAYVTSHRWEALGAGEKAELLIDVPVGGPYCLIELIVASVSALSYQNMYKNVGINDIGTELFVQNKNIGRDEGSVRAYYDGDYALGVDTMINDEIVPGGKGPRSIGSVGQTVGGVIYPGQNFLIVIENATGQNIEVSQRFVWREKNILTGSCL